MKVRAVWRRVVTSRPSEMLWGVNITSRESRHFHNSEWSRQLSSHSSTPKSSVTYLATGLSLGVCGSVLYYGLRKRKASKADGGDNNSLTSSSLELRRFNNKVIVITGAAGDIGGATATAFAREGAKIVLVDLPHTAESLERKCVELERDGASGTSCVVANVTNSEDVQKMVQHVLNKFDHIDYFFNNAGVQGDLLPIHQQQEKNFELVMNVNIYGVFLGMKYIAKAMKESGRGGVIVNTASLAGFQGPPNMVAYAASKFAVVGMTKTAAKDLAPFGIRVCAIAPGLLEGRLWDTQVKGQALCRKRLNNDSSDVTETELKEQEERMINGTPMKRLGKLSEVTSVVTFLCSDAASYLTGTTIMIDGGRLP